MYFTGTLLCLAKSVDEISAANCQISQLQSTMPDYLVFDSTPENDTIIPGIESILKCNSTLLFLEPDVIGNNTLNLACGEDGNFVFPDPWPLCVIKCEVSQISAELGYAPIDGKYLNHLIFFLNCNILQLLKILVCTIISGVYIIRKCLETWHYLAEYSDEVKN